MREIFNAKARFLDFYPHKTMLNQLLNDYKLAMKNKQEPKKLILNYLIAQIKNKKIELQRDPSDDEIIAIIKKEVKSLNEAIAYLQQANKPREEQIETEKKLILESYLPAMMDEVQTKEIITQLISEFGISDLKKERGLLMKELMAKHKSEIDSSLVSKIITDMI